MEKISQLQAPALAGVVKAKNALGAIAEINAGDNSFTRVNAHVPLAEMFGYATAIRSLSRGRASYSMEPAHFEKVPKQVQDKIVEKK